MTLTRISFHNLTFLFCFLLSFAWMGNHSTTLLDPWRQFYSSNSFIVRQQSITNLCNRHVNVLKPMCCLPKKRATKYNGIGAFIQLSYYIHAHSDISMGIDSTSFTTITIHRSPYHQQNIKINVNNVRKNSSFTKQNRINSFFFFSASVGEACVAKTTTTRTNNINNNKNKRKLCEWMELNNNNKI